MGLIVQQKALEAASSLREVMPVIQKRDWSLFDQVHRAMNSVVLNLAEAAGNDPGTSKARFASACGSAKEVRAGLQLAVAYGYVSSRAVRAVDTALDEVCAMEKTRGASDSVREAPWRRRRAAARERSILVLLHFVA